MPSSVIRDMIYDEGARRLTVRFVGGRVYAYDGVPPDVAAALAAAPSKGRYLNAHVRECYPATRLRSGWPGSNSAP